MMPDHVLMGVADDSEATLQLLSTLNETSLTSDKVMAIVRKDSWPSNSLMAFGLGLPRWFLPPHFPSRSFLSHTRAFPDPEPGAPLCTSDHIVDSFDHSLVWVGETAFDPFGASFIVAESFLPCLDENKMDHTSEENTSMLNLSKFFFEYRPFSNEGDLAPPIGPVYPPAPSPSPSPSFEDEQDVEKLADAPPEGSDYEDHDELEDDDIKVSKRRKVVRRVSSTPDVDMDEVFSIPSSCFLIYLIYLSPVRPEVVVYERIRCLALLP